MRMALEWAKSSHSKRNKVGVLIVKDGHIISDGFNGTPSGMDNCCEEADGTTKWFVLHSECNAILKLAKSTQSSVGATMYATLSPCRECSKLIVQSEIKRVVYLEEYRDLSGIEFLKNCGVVVEKIDFINEK